MLYVEMCSKSQIVREDQVFLRQRTRPISYLSTSLLHVFPTYNICVLSLEVEFVVPKTLINILCDN